MNTVFYQTRITDPAFINPADFTKPVPDFPETCISTFSRAIVEKFAAMAGTETIAHLYSANGSNPVYKIRYRGREFAFYLSLVGAPACVCGLEEVIAMGARKFIFFGCCGILNEGIVGNRLIIPSAAVRDEGASYHYTAPGEEILPDPKAGAVLKACMEKCGYPYVSGKIWTTDAIYRETVPAIKERKAAGCVGVDMEYSALLAAAAYRDVSLIQFFYGADSLDNETWQPGDLTDYGLKGAEKYMALALECGLSM